MTDDRLWWQKRLRPHHSGQTATTKANAHWIAKGVSGSIRDGSDTVSHMVERGKELGDTETADDIAACLAFQDYQDAHPEMTVEELLRLPKDEPEPAKPMGKAEIARQIREVKDHRRIIFDLGYLAAAVEALPEPEPSKVSPFAERVASKVREVRDNDQPQEPRLRHAESLREISSLAIAAVVAPQHVTDDWTLDWLSGLAAQCQLTAESLNLIAKESS